MFVCSCMVNSIGLVVGAQRSHTRSVSHTPQDGHDFDLDLASITQGEKFLVNGVKSKFIVIQQHKHARLLAYDLPRKFAANAAAGTRH